MNKKKKKIMIMNIIAGFSIHSSRFLGYKKH